MYIFMYISFRVCVWAELHMCMYVFLYVGGKVKIYSSYIHIRAYVWDNTLTTRQGNRALLWIHRIQAAFIPNVSFRNQADFGAQLR